MEYIEISFQFADNHIEHWQEKLVVELILLGFEGFEESGEVLKGYIQADHYQEVNFRMAITAWENRNTRLTWTINLLKEENWNELWEKSYHPVVIQGKCQIHTPFHTPDPGIPIHIILEPKMAFGTGHHETTFLMLAEILTLPVNGLHVLDVGCGTGLLSILSAKMGALEIMAIDNDLKAIDNCRENLTLNQIENVTSTHSTLNSLTRKKFDCVLANLDKKTVIKDISRYSMLLYEGGNLLISGFFQEDFGAIQTEANKYHLRLARKRERNNWVMARFIKKRVS